MGKLMDFAETAWKLIPRDPPQLIGDPNDLMRRRASRQRVSPTCRERKRVPGDCSGGGMMV